MKHNKFFFYIAMLLPTVSSAAWISIDTSEEQDYISDKPSLRGTIYVDFGKNKPKIQNVEFKKILPSQLSEKIISIFMTNEINELFLNFNIKKSEHLIKAKNALIDVNPIQYPNITLNFTFDSAVNYLKSTADQIENERNQIINEYDDHLQSVEKDEEEEYEDAIESQGAYDAGIMKSYGYFE